MRPLFLVLLVGLLGCDQEPEVPFKSPSVPLTEMNAREQAAFFAQAGIQATGGSVQTFAPSTWTGFSVDPVGDISYLDFGAIVVMWVAGSLTGTSDDVGMSFQGVPEVIRPVTGNKMVRCLVVSGSFTMGGAVEITTTGIMQFSVESTLGGGAGTADDNRTVLVGTGFHNADGKGLPPGWIAIYSK